jgi:hypothetical protein
MRTSKVAWLAVAALSVMATGALAQEPEEREGEEARREPVRKIRVLENPYDIASFYRSDQGRGLDGYDGVPEQTDRYPIAGYYRSRQSRRLFGYSAFWNNGYGYGGTRRRLPLVVGYRRSIGENGDLFLFAPTFLAPVGPLSGAFLGGW